MKNQALIFTVIVSFLMASCRPPNMAQQWNDNPQIDRNQEIPGQKPAGMDFELIHDGRPEYIRNADNPDYDPNSNLWNEVFGGSGENETTSPPRTVDIPPPPKREQYDAYDIANGKIDVTSDLFDKVDPEVGEIKSSIDRTKNGFASNKNLLDQRDYSKRKAEELVNGLVKKKIDPISTDFNRKFEDLDRQIDKAIAAHNQNVTAVTAQIPADGNAPQANGYSYKTPSNSINGQKVRSAQAYVNYARDTVSKMSGPARERGEALVAYAEGTVQVADGYYAEGKQAEGDFALEVGKAVLDIGLGFIPGVGFGKDVYEAISGKKLVGGESLSKFDRTMAVVGILTAGYGSKLAIVAKGAAVLGVFKAGVKEAEAAVEIAQTIKKAEEMVEAAKAAKAVKTPRTTAVQELSKEAIQAREEVKQGSKLYRIGTTGVSETGPKAQYWALEHPLTPGFGEKYGIPKVNIEKADFIETAVIKDDGAFITRVAPPAGGNPGGGIEVVVTEGAVSIQSHATL